MFSICFLSLMSSFQYNLLQQLYFGNSGAVRNKIAFELERHRTLVSRNTKNHILVQVSRYEVSHNVEG